MNSRLGIVCLALLSLILAGSAARAGTVSTDGAWSQQLLLPASGHGAVLDSVRNRMVVILEDRPELWALPLAGPPIWQAIATSAPPDMPEFEDVTQAVYDPIRDRLLIYTPLFGPDQAEVWALSLGAAPTWSRLEVPGVGPQVRHFPALVYDPVGDRLLMYGGVHYDLPDGATVLNDVWSLALAGTPAWSEIVPEGPLPPPLARLSAAVVSTRLMVEGSSGGPGQLWALALTGTPTWTEVADGAGVPSPGLYSRIVADGARSRVLAFDGIQREVLAIRTDDGPSRSWQRIAELAGPEILGFSLIGDPARDRVVLHGGMLNDNTGDRSDTRAFSLADETWTTLVDQPLVPLPRSFAAGAIDSRRDRLVLHGGYLLDDLWALSLGASPGWSPLATTGTSPGERWAHGVVYDPPGDRLIVFGGACGQRPDMSPIVSSELWQLSLSSTPAVWSRVEPAGTPPAPRFLFALVYDPIRQRLILYGGRDGDVCYDDVWELSLAGPLAWRQMNPVEAPGRPVLTAAAAAFDPIRNRVVFFGGGLGADAYLDQTWALDLGGGDGRWVRLAESGSAPSGRYFTQLVYDPIRDRMLLHAGLGFAVGRDGNRIVTW